MRLLQLPLAADWHFIPHWALPWWIIVPCVLISGFLIVYLYLAQQKIASQRAIKVLTAIRVALVLLTFILLAGLGIQITADRASGGTLWIVVDQSGSMNQKDIQAEPYEKLRWADALGYLPAETRPSKLDRSAAKLIAARADLAYNRTLGEIAVEPADAEKKTAQYIESLQEVNTRLAAMADEIDKDPGTKGTDGSIAKALRATSDKMKESLKKGQDGKTRDAVSKEMPWADLKTQLDTTLISLKTLSDKADKDFIRDKGNDPTIVAAMDKVSKETRGDLAAAMLTDKSKLGSTGLVDLVPRQTTKIVSFADAPQLIEIKDAATDLAKAIKTATATAGKSTNIAAPLQFINEQLGQDEPSSVIILSDGRQNVNGDLKEPSRQLAARGVRVYTLAFGSEKVAPDAAVEQIDAPDWIYKDDTLRAQALIRLDGLQGKPVKVEFRRGDALLESETKTIMPTEERETKVLRFNDKPKESGVFEYSVRIVPLDNEAVKENNVQSARVAVKKDKLAVLIIEDQPRWEYRYLANYLERDQRVKLQTVLLTPAEIAEVQRNEPRHASPKNDRTTAELLPEKKEDWAAFDMIVIGDVPRERLTDEQQKNIVSAVKDRGATALLIAGLFNMPQRYGNTTLQELIPVDLSSDWAPAKLQDHMKLGFRPTIAPEGTDSVLSQFSVDEKQNAAIWAAMPDWYWHSEQTQAKAASVVWTIEDSKKDPNAPRIDLKAPTTNLTTAPAGEEKDTQTLGEIRKKALICTMPVGMGRVMYMASDQTWRLRQVGGMNLHERFWGQVIRWVVGNDLPAGGRFVRFGTSKPRYTAGDPVVISARVLGEDFAPLKGEKIKVIAKKMPPKDPKTGKPTGDGTVVGEATLTETPESPGFYRASLNGLGEGTIELTLQGEKVEALLNKDEQATSKSLTVDLVSQLDVEQRNINPDRGALAGVAGWGGGINLDGPYADILAASVPKLNYTSPKTDQYGLFGDPNDRHTLVTHWIFLILFVGLVSAEWIIRKSSGLI